MLFAFIDESYIANDVHIIGALVVTPEQLHNVTMALDDVIWKTNKAHPEVPLNIELHGQQLFQRDGVWACLRDKPSVAMAVYRRALGAIAQAGGDWYVGGVRRIERLARRYDTPWPPHQIALQYALELVHDHAEPLQQTVRVVADHVDDEAHHQARINQFQLNGRTPGLPRHSRSLSTIEQEFRWEDSGQHRGLQAVDLLTFVYFRKRFAREQHRRPKAEIARLADLARPMLRAENVWTP